MRFFPSLTEVFYSPLRPAELLRRVAGSLGPPSAAGGGVGPAAAGAGLFEGKVAADSFAISRVIDYRNSMLPRISGRVAPGPAGGSRLRLQHQLHPAVLVFGAAWLLLVGSVAVGVGQALLSGDVRANLREFTWPALIPVGMFGFGLLLFTVPFWAEVRQSRPHLIALLHLQELPADAG